VNTLAVIREGLLPGGGERIATPKTAVPVAAIGSGYVQAVRVERLLALAHRHRINISVRPRIGEHVVAGTTIAWIWPVTPGERSPSTEIFTAQLHRAIRLGFERTFEQDPALGIRQLCDAACKALSPAVNDPYTAIQAIDHLAVILSALATRPLGDHVARSPDGAAAVIIHGWRFPQYLAVSCGLIRRYGAGEPTVATALLRMLTAIAGAVRGDPGRHAAIDEQAKLIIAEAERLTARREDLAVVHVAAKALADALAGPHRAEQGELDVTSNVPDAPTPH
jgi:uncharacterized membrane protein